MPYRVENVVRKGEIACNKQFLLFSQCFHCYISSVRENGLKPYLNEKKKFNNIARNYNCKVAFSVMKISNRTVRVKD